MTPRRSEEFQRQQIHAVLTREAKRRMELMAAIALYAETSEKHPEDEALLCSQLGLIGDQIQLMVDAARETGRLVGSAT